MKPSPHRAVPAVALALLPVCVLGQTVTISPGYLPASSGSGTLSLTLGQVDPETYQLIASGFVGVRWNGQVLPAQVQLAKYLSSSPPELTISVPQQLRTPGLAEFAIWNTRTHQPLQHRGFVPVIIATDAYLFEVSAALDRVVAATHSQSGARDQINVYRLSTGAQVQSTALAASQRVVAFTPDTMYAWTVEDEAHGLLGRLSLASGQFDQTIQLTYRIASSILGAQVDRSDPSMLIVMTLDETRAYKDGSPLPQTARSLLVSPLPTDDRGRYLVSDGQACELDATVGFTRCADLLPGHPFPFDTVWKDKGLQGGTVFDLKTGSILATNFGTPTYVPESNLLLTASRFISDADTLQPLADLSSVWDSSPIPLGAGSATRVWAPDGVMFGTRKGIFAGPVPQLGPRASFDAGGVTHAATGQAGPIAPGEIISIYGTHLGPAAGSGAVLANAVRLATEVEQTKVLVEGVPAAILFTASTQINAVVPTTIRPGSRASIEVLRYGVPSAISQVQVLPTAPGLFAYAAQNRMYATALTADGRVQGPGVPLQRGSFAVFFGTGIGLPDDAEADTIAVRPAAVPALPSITIGGKAARVLYAGVSPGLTAALTQLNVIVPEDTPVGAAVEVVISMGNQSQTGVWVAIQ